LRSQKDPVLRQGKRYYVGIFENVGERLYALLYAFMGEILAVSTSYYSVSSKGWILINPDLSERRSSGLQS
jgi:hypothetical protein